MDRTVPPPSHHAAPPAAGLRQRARHWVTAGKPRRWWIGLGLLRFHFSLYLAAVPSLFLVNLIQSPADLWIDRAALAWLALLVVHAAIVGLIWAIAIWQREGTVPERPPGAMSQPRSTWITSRAAEPQDAEYRASGSGDATPRTSWGMPTTAPDTSSSSWGTVSVDEAAPGPRQAPAPAIPENQGSIWGDLPSRTLGSGTSTVAGTHVSGDAPSSERVSWRTVTDAAWLTPSHHYGDAPSDSSSESDEQKPA